MLAIFALLLVPTFALAFAYSGDDDAVCLAPEPPGDSLTVVAFLDLCHGWSLGSGPVLRGPACGFAALPSGEPTPQGLAWTVALVGRPPPPNA